MSLKGKYTSLQLNALDGLIYGIGFRINPFMTNVIGTWYRSPEQYNPGSIITGTILKDLTRALPLIHGAVTLPTWRRLISIGSDTIPLLGNSRPTTFTRTYPNVADPYPPDNYPIYPSPNNNTQAVSDLNYGWLTGWTRSSYESAAEFNSGAYCAADTYFRYGFLCTLSMQGYYEFWNYSYESRHNHYLRLIRSIQYHKSYRDTSNRTIASFKNTKSFLHGGFSNINDLTTSDISGVSIAFALFGQDLIDLGRAIDLKDISEFGRTDKFLLNLQRNGAITTALKLALVTVGLSTETLNEILVNNRRATNQELGLIWQAMSYIKTVDLAEIKILLNCQTKNLTSLQDLLTVNKMFPRSKNTLTVPEYRLDTVSSKVYDFIYVGDGLNNRIADHSDYLNNTLPEDVARACAAFSYTMQQVKNITRMNFETFAQVVSQFEVTNKGLPLTNSETGVPGSKTAADEALFKIALGSGNSGTYCMTDFTGAISGDQYEPVFQPIINALQNIYNAHSQLATQLKETYYNILWWITNPNGTRSEAELNNYITQANDIIRRIYLAAKLQWDTVNYYYNSVGTILALEQRAIPFSVSVISLIVDNSNRNDFYQFMSDLENWADQTDYKEIARLIERISNTDNIHGQSMVALLRESRNAKRLALLNSNLDTDVPDNLKSTQASLRATVVDGRVVGVEVVNGGSGYDTANPPQIYTLLPPGVGATTPKLTPNLVNIGSFDSRVGGAQSLGSTIASVTVNDGGSNLPDNVELLVQENPDPVRKGLPESATIIPDLALINTVPPELYTQSDSSYTEDGAIEDVTICNCECWQE